MPLSNEAGVLLPAILMVSAVLMHVLVTTEASWSSRLAVEADDWYGRPRIAWFPYQDDARRHAIFWCMKFHQKLQLAGSKLHNQWTKNGFVEGII